jgi:hypothetical protein
MGNSATSIIKTICPELAASLSMNEFVDMAVELTDRGYFGKLYPYAVAYRACHLFVITGGGGNGNSAIGTGQIASMSEGGLSVNFATGAASDSGGLDTTKYGKLLLSLIKSRPTMGINTEGLHCPPHGGYR